MMTNKGKILTFCLFILVLTSIRLVWITVQQMPKQSSAVQGIMNLQAWSPATSRPVTLNGEWEFYPHTFLYPSHQSAPSPSEGRYISVPGNWSTALAPSDYDHPTFGFGTYRLVVQVAPDPDLTYGIRIPGFPGASELYINGRLVASSGKIGFDREHYLYRNVPYYASFSGGQDKIEVVIQGANFQHSGKGGLMQPVLFGSSQAVEREVWFSIGMQWSVVMILLIHAVYAVIISLIGTPQKGILLFAMLNAAAILMTMTDDNKLLFMWLPAGFEWSVKLTLLPLVTVVALLLQLLKQLITHKPFVLGTLFKFSEWMYAVKIVLIISLPAGLLLQPPYIFILLMPFAMTITALPILFRAALSNQEDAFFLLLGVSAVALNTLWGFIKGNVLIEMYYYPIDLIAAFLAFASYWFKSYFRKNEETVQLTRRLQKADKQKDDFLANTSHELRNPLHGILNIAQSVLDGERLTMKPKNTENMKLLLAIGRKMSFTLNDLLDLTKLRETGIRLELSNLSIQAVASGVFDMLQHHIQGKPVQFVNDIPAGFPPVLADENRLTQILFNLLHNAMKYTNEGSITIQAELNRNEAWIHVTDTGIGIDQQTQQRIFLPYEQGESGFASTGGGGIGLGLSICKQLVELHGGSLRVASVPGSGSVFTFTLPLAQPASPVQELPASAEADAQPVHTAESLAAAAAEPPGEPAETTGLYGKDRLKVLAVDDDAVNLNILTEILSSEVYDITTVTSGAEALPLLDLKEWDLVISDVMMPQMSGYELSRSIRERFSMSELPILLLTARSRPEDIETGFLAGANDYVTKPVDSMELRARVQALTDMKNSARERQRMEAALLQAQIQPHFLFNTLNSISALSTMDTTKMRTLLGVFGSYLRASFDFHNLERLVPLEHELHLVRSYLFIEKERFADRLQVVWEVDESIPLQLPPLSIQPLVENAVKHGVLARPQGGEILIRIHHAQDYAEVMVADNGIGIPSETIRRILSSDTDNSLGIGIRNPDRRLKQIYGRGLHIQSSPGEGTKISFIIPK